MIYAFSVWLISIRVHVIEHFNHCYTSFVLKYFFFGVEQHCVSKIKVFHYSISILSNLIDESPCCQPYKWMVLHWRPAPVFPMNKLLAKGVLIFCSFLRLIIHSTASSCYRCPALHPCSSHWGLTLKKNASDGHLPRGKEEALWPSLFCPLSRQPYLLFIYAIHYLIQIVMWKYIPANLVTNEQPGFQLSRLRLKMGALTCNWWKESLWLSHSSLRELSDNS